MGRKGKVPRWLAALSGWLLLLKGRRNRRLLQVPVRSALAIFTISWGMMSKKVELLLPLLSRVRLLL